jgi:hypothetical protein
MAKEESRIAEAIRYAFVGEGGLLEDPCMVDALMSLSRSVRGSGGEENRSVVDALFEISASLNRVADAIAAGTE